MPVLASGGIVLLIAFFLWYTLLTMPVKMDQSPTVGEVLHRWTIHEYYQFERATPWYIVMILAGLFFVSYGLIAGNFLFSLIIILFAVIIFLQSHQDPPAIPFQITKLGIIISNRFYTYSELDGFYIIYEPPHVKTLYIETQSFFRPLIRIPLYDENPVEIRHTLQNYLVEDLDKEEEPISDKIARGWGFH